MGKQEIIELIEKIVGNKMLENENYLRITFYELRVKHDLSEEEIDVFLKFIKNKLEKMNYNIYFTGAKFIYENSNRTVQSNELMIAIKENMI